MGDSARLRILIVDDHPIIRFGLRAAFQCREYVSLVSEAASGEQALATLATQAFDFVLLDLRMPGLSGAPLIQEIHRLYPLLHILVFSGFASEEEVFAAFQSGARGYILKGSSDAEIDAAIKWVEQGHRWIPPVIATRYGERLQRSGLTKRERETLQLLAEGLDNRSIANALHISESTVRNRITDLLAKLEANDRLQAVLLAMQRGLVSPD